MLFIDLMSIYSVSCISDLAIPEYVHGMHMYSLGVFKMTTATERVSVLMTKAEKKRVVSKARKSGVSVGEYLRRAADGYRVEPDEQLLKAMIVQMNQATENAERAIDETLRFVEESNQRIAQMEAEAKSKAA
jgi:hypothetical protein